MRKFDLKNWIFPNSLKFWYRGTLLYPYFDFDVYFSKIFVINILFGQIWSQNLKFSKLTEIWYSSTFLYTYFGFNVYFFKIFVIHILWANLVPKSEVLQVKQKFDTGVHCYLVIMILMFSFSKFCDSYNFGQI